MTMNVSPSQVTTITKIDSVFLIYHFILCRANHSPSLMEPIFDVNVSPDIPYSVFVLVSTAFP